jgi:hypothetical protein
MPPAYLAAGGALLGGTSSLVGGKKGANAATQAASIQAAAATYGAQLTQERFEQVAGMLQPFVSYGQSYLPTMQQLLGAQPGQAPTAQSVLASPLGSLPGTWSPTMADLGNMPGYQFQLQQGLLAAQNQQAAMGLGRSGSATKAATQYASGLAASNWGQNAQQFYQQQALNMAGQQQLYNFLSGGINTGLTAGGAIGGVSVPFTAAQVNQANLAAASTAGGVTSAANQLIGGGQAAASSFASAPYMYAATSQMLGNANPLVAGQNFPTNQDFSSGATGPTIIEQS